MSQKWGGKKLLKAVYILRSRRFWRSLRTNGLWLFSLGPLWLGFLQWMTSSLVYSTTKAFRVFCTVFENVPKCLIFVRIKLTPVLSSSLIVNSLFLTTFKFCLKLYSAAFFCKLANLFSCLVTFFKEGFTLERKKID